jgi:hypothetical protein
VAAAKLQTYWCTFSGDSLMHQSFKHVFAFGFARKQLASCFKFAY